MVTLERRPYPDVKRGVWGACTLVVVVASATACARPAAQDARLDTLDAVIAEAERVGASEAQLSLLRDGSVSREDLAVAFDNVRVCVEALGMRISEPVVNPVDGWRLDATVSTNGQSGNEQEIYECQDSQMTFVELGYELTHEDRMDAALMAATLACMAESGIPHNGDEQDLADLVPRGPSDATRARAVEGCIVDSARDLFPGVDLAMVYR